tara:strand:+ start:477 stop:647 length:171 start_codon:yes stop_codon:yes gene_type:complete
MYRIKECDGGYVIQKKNFLGFWTTPTRKALKMGKDKTVKVFMSLNKAEVTLKKLQK